MQRIPVRQLTLPPQPSPVAEKFTIRRVEDIVGNRDLVHDLHRHDFFFILAIENGEGIHEIDFIPHAVGPNTVFFLRPGQVHRLELRAGSRGYLAEFNREFYSPADAPGSQYLKKASSKNACRLEPGRFDRMLLTLRAMHREYTEREEAYAAVIRSGLQMFCIEYVRSSVNPGNNGRPANTYAQERLEEFLHLLERYLSTHKQVADYVDRMNLSPYQLNEITKSTLGKTASQLINEQIVLEAKRYLQATPNQVKEIAELLGYEDVSYFIRFFKKQTGYSPDAFRHQAR